MRRRRRRRRRRGGCACVRACVSVCGFLVGGWTSMGFCAQAVGVSPSLSPSNHRQAKAKAKGSASSQPNQTHQHTHLRRARPTVGSVAVAPGHALLLAAAAAVRVESGAARLLLVPVLGHDDWRARLAPTRGSTRGSILSFSPSLPLCFAYVCACVPVSGSWFLAGARVHEGGTHVGPSCPFPTTPFLARAWASRMRHCPPPPLMVARRLPGYGCPRYEDGSSRLRREPTRHTRVG